MTKRNCRGVRRQVNYRDTLLYAAITEFCEQMHKRGWMTITHKPECRSLKGETCDCEYTAQTTKSFQRYITTTPPEQWEQLLEEWATESEVQQ